MLPAMVNVVGEQRTRGQAQVTMPVVVAGRAGGPLGPWAPGFAEWLGSRGYAPETVAGYLRWLGWLSGWLAERGLAADALTGVLAAQFAASMRAAGHPKITPGRLATMLSYLCEAGAVPPERARPPGVTPRERVLAAYREYMARRDLAPGTVAARLRVAGMFLDGLGGDAAADDLEDLTPRQVLAVLGSWGLLARRRSSELRAFLRYLRAAGCTIQDLAAVVFTARRGAPPRRAARLDRAQAVASPCTHTTPLPSGPLTTPSPGAISAASCGRSGSGAWVSIRAIIPPPPAAANLSSIIAEMWRGSKPRGTGKKDKRPDQQACDTP